LEDTISKVVHKESKQTQTQCESTSHDLCKDEMEMTEEHVGLRQRKTNREEVKKRKIDHKRNHSTISNYSLTPYVDTIVNEEKKKAKDTIKSSTLHTNTTIPIFNYEMNEKKDYITIDIDQDDDMSYVNRQDDTNHFFLPITGNPITHPVDKETDLFKKIIDYELEIKKLKEQNQEFQNKIYSYECNSILGLNRKIRSGVPVRFFPYHSNHTYSNTSQINTLEFDLH